MKKLFLTLFLTVMATAALQAQQISVVSSGGTTKLYSTLAEAINGADPGSVIYLPGGGFTIADSVKITKKLTIIGIGHKANTDNVDGSSIINGNLFFNEGSSGSAVMGCYITGNVNIGDDGKSVNNILIRYCLVYNYLYVKNNTCRGITINQNYIRSSAYCYGSNPIISNNIIYAIHNVDGGVVKNNIIMGCVWNGNRYKNTAVFANNSIISNNVVVFKHSEGTASVIYLGDNNIISNNMSMYNSGEDPIIIGDTDWSDIFVNYNSGAISPTSNFHFKEAYAQYENKVGIYAGDGFNDNQMAPVPYIVGKYVDQQTDAQGKLNIKIRVKAAQ